MTFWEAFLLGIVEGLTEFLPISSTGHLMLTSEALGIEATDFRASFTIAIQLGAILAVVVLYWRSFLVDSVVLQRVVVAFIPTAALGYLLYPVVTELLKSTPVALWSLALGGAGLILFEVFHGERRDAQEGLKNVSLIQAVAIGLCQVFAMLPGVSRAGATVVGGMVLGLTRKTVVEFSFLLAVPTMAAATGYDLMQTAGSFSGEQVAVLAFGFVISFIMALAAIGLLLRFIKTHTFVAFGVYRIVAALAFCVILYF
jgi:undecaprenyl-diphosphatase